MEKKPRKLWVKEVYVENWRGLYGKHTVELKPGLTFILAEHKTKYTDSNAGGKTSILLAIEWCLCDSTPLKIPNSELCNEHADNMLVAVTLSDDTQVVRTWSKRGSKVTFKGLDGRVNESDNKIVQGLIESHLRINSRIYEAAFFLGREATSGAILRAEPAKRAELLSYLIDDSLYQEAAVVAKDQKLKYEKEAHKLEMALQRTDAQIVAHEAQLRDLKELAKDHKRQNDARVSQLQQKITTIKSEIRKLDVILLSPILTPRESLDQLRTELVLRRKKVEEMLREITAIRSHGLGEGEVCPHCHSVMTFGQLQRSRKIVEEAKGRRNTLNTELQGIDAGIEKVHRDLEEIKEQESEMRQARREKERFETELAHLQDELKQSSPTNSTLSAQISAVRTKLDELVQLQAKETAEHKKALVLARKLDPLIGGFSKDIRNILLDEIREHLIYYTDSYLSESYGDNMKVLYPPTKGTQEKFVILVSAGEDKSPRRIESFSCGEGMRASFACLLALRETVATVAKSRFAGLFVDDPIGGMDVTGMEMLTAMLRELGEKDPELQLLVTVPVDSWVRPEDRVIRVVRTGRNVKITC